MNTVVVHPRYLILPVSLMLSLPAESVRAEFGGNIAAGFSDNIARTDGNEISERVLAARVGGEATAQSPGSEGEVRWELGAITYSGETFDDEGLASLDGLARIDLVGNRVFWSFRDWLGRSSLDPFAPVTPASTEYVNYFSTGPRFLLPLSDHAAVDLSMDYGDVWYEEQQLDSSRASAQVGLRFALSARSSFGIYTADEEVDFDDGSLYPSYESYRTYLQYETQRRRSDARLALGSSRIRRAGVGSDSPTLEAAWVRQLSAYGSFTLEATKGFSDAGELLGQGGLGAGGITPEQFVVSSADPVDLTYFLAEFSVDRTRSSASIGYTFTRQEFESVEPVSDYEVPYWQVRYSRRFSPGLRVGLAGSYSEQELAAESRVDRERSVAINFSWDIGRDTIVDVELMRLSRTSSAQGSVFEENRVFVTLGHGAGLSRFESGL